MSIGEMIGPLIGMGIVSYFVTWFLFLFPQNKFRAAKYGLGVMLVMGMMAIGGAQHQRYTEFSALGGGIGMLAGSTFGFWRQWKKWKPLRDAMNGE
jgi:hypothetical protein